MCVYVFCWRGRGGGGEGGGRQGGKAVGPEGGVAGFTVLGI